jgi:hypothetical protein
MSPVVVLLIINTWQWDMNSTNFLLNFNCDRQQREPAKKKKEETHILETNNSGPSLETNHSGPSSSFTDVECITYQVIT